VAKELDKTILDFPVSDVIILSGNSKHHPRHQVDQLKINIQRFGFTRPILLSSDWHLIAGHCGLQAVKELGWETVPAIKMNGFTGSDVRAVRISDNRIAELGETNQAALSMELAELAGELDFDMDGLGFMDEELAELIEWCGDEDPLPPDPPPRKTRAAGGASNSARQGPDRVVEGDPDRSVPDDLGMDDSEKWRDCPYRDRCGHLVKLGRDGS